MDDHSPFSVVGSDQVEWLSEASPVHVKAPVVHGKRNRMLVEDTAVASRKSVTKQ